MNTLQLVTVGSKPDVPSTFHIPLSEQQNLTVETMQAKRLFIARKDPLR